MAPRLVALLLFLGALSPAAASDAPTAGGREGPWLRGAFESTPRELVEGAAERLAAHEDLVADAGAVVLYQHASYSYDALGRATFRRHWVFVVRDAAAVAEWSKLEVRWSPWHQARPMVEGRVVAPDGRQEEVRPRHVRELADRRGEPGGPAGSSDDGASSDRRRWLRVELPGVETGSVVEVVTEVRDLGPAFDAGVTQRHYFVMFVPILHHRLEIRTSKRLPLRFGAHGWDLPGREDAAPRPETSETAERFRLAYEVGAMPAATEPPEGLPGQLPRWPHVAFSNGRSWRTVASRYAQLAERSLRYDLEDLDAELAGRLDATLNPDERRPADRALAVLQVLRGRVTHDGSELEASPPGPRRLTEILETGRGNAVDVATLAVAALRRAGLPARVALVDAGFGVDVERRLPGLGLFNHALVRLPPSAELPEGLWIDPGAPWSRPGELPLVDQGRLALVADPQTDDLVLTPASRPEENRVVEERHVRLADWGLGDLVERSVYRGAAEQAQRAVTAGLDAAARRRGYLAYVRSFHRAADLGRLRETAPEALERPFEVELEILGSARVRTDLESARVEIPAAEIARRLPAVFRRPLSEPRRHEFVFHEPFVTEWRYAMPPPPGFEPGRLPSDRELTLGAATYRQEFRVVKAPGGPEVQGRLVFDVGQRRLTADQFERMHAALRGLLEMPPLVVEFVPLGRHESDPGHRLALLAGVVAEHPEVPSHRVRLVDALLAAGLGEEAVRQARQAVAAVPGWAPSHLALGRALAHDALGRFAGPGADLEAARDALREARRLAPGDDAIREGLADLAAAESSGATSDEAAPDSLDLAADDPLHPVARLVRGGDGIQPPLQALHPRERRRVSAQGFGSYLERVEPLRRGTTTLDELEIDGARHLGYRIHAGSARLYVSLAEGGLRVAGHDGVPAALGLEALHRLVRGDLAGARQWLDWAFEETQGDSGAKPRLEPFRAVWPPPAEEPTVEELRLAAATLASSLLSASVPGPEEEAVEPSKGGEDLAPRAGELAESALRWLEDAAEEGLETSVQTGGETTSRRAAARRALAEGLFSAGRVREAAERAAELEPSPARRDLELRARVQLGEWERVEELLEEASESTRTTLRARGALEIARGDKAAAFEALRELEDRDLLENGDAHRWVLLLLAPDVTPGTRDVEAVLRHAATSTDPVLRRRVAALLAGLGRIAEAREHLVRAVELRGEGSELQPGDHYVLGRIAEAGGLPAAAARHYRRALGDPDQGPVGRLQTEADRDALVYHHLARAALSRL